MKNSTLLSISNLTLTDSLVRIIVRGSTGNLSRVCAGCLVALPGRPDFAANTEVVGEIEKLLTSCWTEVHPPYEASDACDCRERLVFVSDSTPTDSVGSPSLTRTAFNGSFSVEVGRRVEKTSGSSTIGSSSLTKTPTCMGWVVQQQFGERSPARSRAQCSCTKHLDEPLDAIDLDPGYLNCGDLAPGQGAAPQKVSLASRHSRIEKKLWFKWTL